MVDLARLILLVFPDLHGLQLWWQDLACQGVLYLCQFVNDKGGKAPEFLLVCSRSWSLLTF